MSDCGHSAGATGQEESVIVSVFSLSRGDQSHKML